MIGAARLARKQNMVAFIFRTIEVCTSDPEVQCDTFNWQDHPFLGYFYNLSPCVLFILKTVQKSLWLNRFTSKCSN